MRMILAFGGGCGLVAALVTCPTLAVGQTAPQIGVGLGLSVRGVRYPPRSPEPGLAIQFNRDGEVRPSVGRRLSGMLTVNRAESGAGRGTGTVAGVSVGLGPQSRGGRLYVRLGAGIAELRVDDSLGVRHTTVLTGYSAAGVHLGSRRRRLFLEAVATAPSTARYGRVFVSTLLGLRWSLPPHS